MNNPYILIDDSDFDYGEPVRSYTQYVYKEDWFDLKAKVKYQFEKLQNQIIEEKINNTNYLNKFSSHQYWYLLGMLSMIYDNYYNRGEEAESFFDYIHAVENEARFLMWSDNYDDYAHKSWYDF